MSPQHVETPGPERLIHWLATVARERREAAGLRQVHVAAKMNRDQSTVYKFEQGRWLRDTELTVGAYAELVGVPAEEIWLEAVTRWQREGQAATVEEMLAAEGAPNPLAPIVDRAARGPVEAKPGTRQRARAK